MASEITALSGLVDLTVATYASRMFHGDDIHPAIERACYATGTRIIGCSEAISSDNIIVHNPSFLKFDNALSFRLCCDRLIVVCHENFERPSGAPGFDVDHCLKLLESNSLVRNRILAPVSGCNRVGVENWVDRRNTNWQVASEDWTNICDFTLVAPTKAPRDRRGRHSRPGYEKFPDKETLQLLFPDSCDSVRILGADSLLDDDLPARWDLIPFRREDVDVFLRSIDFFVYFTNASWRESFGRAIAEAIAAGKLVITDEETARTFGRGVVNAAPHEVNDIVRSYVDNPQDFERRVREAQKTLDRYSAEAFLARARKILKLNSTVPCDPKSRMEALHAFV